MKTIGWAADGALQGIDLGRHGRRSGGPPRPFAVPKHHDIRDVVPQPGNGPPWLGFRGAAPTSTNKEDPRQFREQPGMRCGFLYRLERWWIAQKVRPPANGRAGLRTFHGVGCPDDLGRSECARAVTFMLRNTFIHLPGVGLQRERALWDQGILDWDQFLTTAQAGRLRGRSHESAVELVRHSLAALASGDAGFFKPHLPAREAWRLYSEFADRALFLDIETTGLSGEYDDVTVIGALGNGELALFIKGINLEQFPAYIAQFPLLVSFNGSQFDVPFLRTHFPQARLDQSHIDLRFVLASLGYKGGLKVVES